MLCLVCLGGLLLCHFGVLSKHLHRGCYDLFGLLHNLWGERSMWEYLSRVWFQLGLCQGLLSLLFLLGYFVSVLDAVAVYQHGL